MNKAELTETILTIVADQFGRDISTINLQTRFSDLGADSLDTIEVVMSIEEELEIDVEDDDIAKMDTVGDVIEHVYSITR